MQNKEKLKNEMIIEINNVISGKIYNFEHKTISIMEKQTLFEALGFLNMLEYSSMPIEEIKKYWDKSNLACM